MIFQIAAIIVSLGLGMANSEPVVDPIYTCQFKAGRIVIEKANEAGEVTVEVGGTARQYVKQSRKLVPREQNLPSLLFDPDLKQWKMLNELGEPIESVVCTEMPQLKTG